MRRAYEVNSSLTPAASSSRANATSYEKAICMRSVRTLARLSSASMSSEAELMPLMNATFLARRYSSAKSIDDSTDSNWL